MARKIILGLGISVLALIVGCVLWMAVQLFSSWNGDISGRNLRPGDVVFLQSGVSITVPPGWQGGYTTFVEFPGWMPFRHAEDLHMSDMLSLWRSDHTGDVIAATYYRDDRVPPTGEILARSGDATVFTSSKTASSTAVMVTSVSGRPKGYVMLRLPAGGTTLESARKAWTMLKATGATMP